MKRLIFIVLGVLLLLIDVDYPTGRAYPEYIKLEQYGPAVQEQVMYHMVGDELLIDLAPDVIGYFFLILSALLLCRYQKGVLLSIPFALAGGILSVLIPQLPFLLSGASVFIAEYCLHFVMVPLEIFSIYFIIRGLCRATDCIENHMSNNILFVCVYASFLCILVKAFSEFYTLNGITIAYFVVQLPLTLVYCNRILHNRHYLPGVKRVWEDET